MKDPAADKDADLPAQGAAKVDAPREAVPSPPREGGRATPREGGRATPRDEARAPPREEPAHPGASLSPPGTVPESDVRTHSPAAATPPGARLPFAEELGELPWGYGDGRLICLVRDPSTLYVYWDLSQQQVEQAFGGLGSAQALLKLCSVRGEVVRQLEVHLGGRCWYVHDLPPGAELRAELWAKGEKGARLLRSGRPVRLPPAGPSNALEELYAVLPVSVPLPRDGQLSAGRPLDWKSGAEPPDWDRRGSARGPSGYPGIAQPWSGTPPGEAPGGAEGEEARPSGRDKP